MMPSRSRTVLQASSSDGQSIGFLIRWPRVRVPPGALHPGPASCCRLHGFDLRSVLPRVGRGRDEGGSQTAEVRSADAEKATSDSGRKHIVELEDRESSKSSLESSLENLSQSSLESTEERLLECSLHRFFHRSSQCLSYRFAHRSSQGLAFRFSHRLAQSSAHLPPQPSSQSSLQTGFLASTLTSTYSFSER